MIPSETPALNVTESFKASLVKYSLFDLFALFSAFLLPFVCWFFRTFLYTFKLKLN
jgi:ABC-type multidrug transport system permease subunit